MGCLEILLDATATVRELHLIFSGCEGYQKATVNSHLGLVHFSSPSLANRAIDSRRTTSWSPEGELVSMRLAGPTGSVTPRRKDLTPRVRGEAQQSKKLLLHAMEQKSSRELDLAISKASEFWPETDPDLLQGQNLLAQLTRPVEMRKALGAHGRAQVKLAKFHPRNSRSVTPPRRAREMRGEALSAATSALSSGVATNLSVLRKTERAAREFSESWTNSAWADLSQALETRNFDLLPEAIEECEAVLNAIHAADLAQIGPAVSAEMQDLLQCAVRIAEGSSGFGLEQRRWEALQQLRGAVKKQRGAEPLEELPGLSLSSSLALAQQVGLVPGSTADDCVGQAMALHAQLEQQLPVRWVLMACLLLGKAASFWESVTCISRLQKATELAKDVGIGHEELGNAYTLEAKFDQHHSVARRLDEALKTGADLPAAVEDARAVAVEGGQLQVQSHLSKALKLRPRQSSFSSGSSETDLPGPGAWQPWAVQHLKEALDMGSAAMVASALRRCGHLDLAEHQGILQEAEHFLQEQELLSNMARLAQNRDLAGLRDAVEDAEQLGLDTRQFQELLHSFSGQVEEIRGRLRKIEEYMITFEAVKCQKNGTWPTVEAKLSQRGLTVIHEVAEILKDFPGLPVRIEGFSNDSNCIRGKALSQARAQLVKDCLLKSGCTNWMTIVAWGIGHEMKKKVVRIVPQVNLDDEDCDSTLLQLLRESFDRNQEPKIGSGSVSNEMVMEREQKDNVHSQETEKASVSQVSMPSRASALRKGSASSGFLECW